WRVEYQNDNPNSTPHETLVTVAEAERLPDGALYGHIALQRSLAHKLGFEPPAATQVPTDGPRAFHVVRCTSPTSARDVALLARGRGLLVDIRVADEGWTVEIAQPLPASRRVIQSMEEDLRTIAAACDAEYAGFERGR
ncbi:MAG: hypothetical protein M3P18_09520, partial [Actinomycetota bacterium]|nr:hypothetical protein [Actinomycetota bacterium]